MKQTTKETLWRKLTSRKFWLTVAGLVGTLCAAIGFGDTLAAKITSVITAGGLIIAYIFGESLTDAAYAVGTEPAKEETPKDPEETSEVPETEKPDNPPEKI